MLRRFSSLSLSRLAVPPSITNTFKAFNTSTFSNPFTSLFTKTFPREVRAFSVAQSVLPPAFSDFDFPKKVLRLNDLRDIEGANKRYKRVGRGPGSKLGKSCGKGMKGTYHRHRGLGKRGFEGNQAPLWRVTPKRGHNTKNFARPLNVLNLDRLQMWVNKGRLNPGGVITMRHLRDSGILGNAKVPHGIKVLARGKEKLKTSVNLEVTFASEEAKEAIEAVGGTVKFVWFAKIPLRAHLKPHKFDILPKSNGVPPAKYYNRYGLELEAKPRVSEVVGAQ